MEESTTPWLDRATLQMLKDLGERRGKDLLGQLYEMFQSQGPSGISELRRAIDVADSTAVADTAHSLKGSYRSLGTPRLAEIAADLEADGRADRLTDAAAKVDALEAAFRRTDEALAEFLAGRRST